MSDAAAPGAGFDPKFYVGVILFASFLEFWAAAFSLGSFGTDALQEEAGWAVVQGLISLVVCIIMIVLFFFCADPAQKAQPFVAIGLCIWWTIGVAVCCFKNPFHSACSYGGDMSGAWSAVGTANGFFSTWLAAIASAMWMQHSWPQIMAMMGKVTPTGNDSGMLTALFLASLVCMIQAIYDCGMGDCEGGEVWAMILGALSLIVVLVMAFLTLLVQFKGYISAGLTILWLLGVCTLTYAYKDGTGAFATSGNGYFSVWAGVLCAAALAMLHLIHAGGDVSFLTMVREPRVYIGVIAIASFFEMWAAGNICNKSELELDCQDELGYAVALGFISLLVTVVLLVLYLAKKDWAVMALPFVAVFLFLWWFCGVAVCTFQGPFKSPCKSGAPNGYYGCWISMLASTILLMEVPKLQEYWNKACAFTGPDSSMLGFLALSSTLCWIQGAYDCDQYSTDGCTNGNAWAIAGGVISFVLAMLVMLLPPIHGNPLICKIIQGILVVLWMLVIIPLTYTYKDSSAKGDTGTFAFAGNGFFACWSSFFVSTVLFIEAVLGIQIFSSEASPAGVDAEAPGVAPTSVEVNVESNKAADDSAVEGEVTASDAQPEEPAPEEDEDDVEGAI